MFVGSGASAATMISPSTSGYLLTSNGTGSDPAFELYTGSTDIHTIGEITNDIVLNKPLSHGDRSLGVIVAGSGDDGDDLTIYAGGVSGLAPGDMDGGNLILKSGAGDGTGTSEIQFWVKQTAIDAAVQAVRIYKSAASTSNIEIINTDTGKIGVGERADKNTSGNNLIVSAGDVSSSCDAGDVDGGNLLLKSGDTFGDGESYIGFWTSGRGDTAVAERWRVSDSGTFMPRADSTYDIGESAVRPATIFCDTLTHSGGSLSSDRRIKKKIADEHLGIDFINKLKPVSFRWNEKARLRDEGLKTHGFIAQDVIELFEGSSAVKHDQEIDEYSLDYIQFIAPLVKSVQELSKKVESLEKQLEKVNKTK